MKENIDLDLDIDILEMISSKRLQEKVGIKRPAITAKLDII